MTSKTTEEARTDSFYKDNLWQLRPCYMYETELKYCQKKTCQLYTEWRTGQKEDCSVWERFFKSCSQYNETENVKYAKEIIDFEISKREERLKNAKANNVWEYRVPFWDDKKIKEEIMTTPLEK